MRFVSTRGQADPVSFRVATLAGLAPDGGLYLPEELPQLGAEQLDPQLSFTDRAMLLARPLVEDDFNDAELADLCHSTFDFPVKLVDLDNGLHVLELFWGPTFAFKDFGARFLARVMNRFTADEGQRLTILVATSGDTGSAVAHGFAGMDAIDVVLLYPSGRVSPLQEKQLTTVGGNVSALEVAGTFDDCQAMVKQAFADAELQALRPLSSANSINIGRLLPQIFYYVHAIAVLAASPTQPAVICVPSGNYGNVTGALMAWLMGLPVKRLVVGSNENDVVPRFLETGIYKTRETVTTPANAMDVGNPSNMARIQSFLAYDLELITQRFRGFKVTTPEIFETIREVKEETGYLLDPHSAVGYRALQRYRDESGPTYGPHLFAATAHPAKFSEAIKAAIGEDVEIPDGLQLALQRPKNATQIDADAARLKEYLVDTAKYRE
jgi:threonine synthase